MLKAKQRGSWIACGAIVVGAAVLFTNGACQMAGNASVASVRDMAAPWVLTVVDKDRRPVAGADVVVQSLSMDFSMGKTDSAGRCDIQSFYIQCPQWLSVKHSDGQVYIKFPKEWPYQVMLGAKLDFLEVMPDGAGTLGSPHIGPIQSGTLDPHNGLDWGTVKQGPPSPVSSPARVP